MEDVKFLETILKEIVLNPNEVKVEKKMDAMGVMMEVKINSEDAGFVIGREGRVVQAIRMIMKSYGMKNHEKIAVRLVNIPEKPPEKPIEPKEESK